MSANNRANPSCRNGRNWRVRAGRRIQSSVCVAVLVATLPFASGCTPEMFAGGALAISLLSAHLKNTNPPAKPPEPTVSRPARTVYLSQARASYANDMSGQSNPATNPHTFSQSERPPVQISPVAEALQAYKQMQWKEASRVLSDAIERKDLSNSELCQAYTLLGAMEYQTGRLQAARTYFVKAYQHDPEAVPSPELFPPQVIEFYNSVRKRGDR